MIKKEKCPKCKKEVIEFVFDEGTEENERYYKCSCGFKRHFKNGFMQKDDSEYKSLWNDLKNRG